MMSAYADDVLQFDATGALAQRGAAEVRKTTRAWFEGWERGIDFEMRDLTIDVDGDVAFAHSFNRSAGTTKQGRDVEMWVRWTACFRKRDGAWKLVHEHVSVPFDRGTLKAELALKP
jgi:ketosteroid isomerase-like protein